MPTSLMNIDWQHQSCCMYWFWMTPHLQLLRFLPIFLPCMAALSACSLQGVLTRNVDEPPSFHAVCSHSPQHPWGNALLTRKKTKMLQGKNGSQASPQGIWIRFKGFGQQMHMNHHASCIWRVDTSYLYAWHLGPQYICALELIFFHQTSLPKSVSANCFNTTQLISKTKRERERARTKSNRSWIRAVRNLHKSRVLDTSALKLWILFLKIT